VRGRGAVEKRDCQDEQAGDRDGGAGTGDATGITLRLIHEEAPESVLLLGWAGAAPAIQRGCAGWMCSTRRSACQPADVVPVGEGLTYPKARLSEADRGGRCHENRAADTGAHRPSRTWCA
jgi:hypothetical protein